MADPRPEYRPGTQAISAFVSGATTHASPSPKMIPYGRMSMKTLGGGISEAGLSSDAFHGVESAGIRAYHRAATPMSVGPIRRKRREPTRPAIDPIRVDRTARMIPAGIPTMPAASAV